MDKKIHCVWFSLTGRIVNYKRIETTTTKSEMPKDKYDFFFRVLFSGCCVPFILYNNRYVFWCCIVCFLSFLIFVFLIISFQLLSSYVCIAELCVAVCVVLVAAFDATNGREHAKVHKHCFVLFFFIYFFWWVISLFTFKMGKRTQMKCTYILLKDG